MLLIITDGQISDMEETTDEIIRCSDLPLSIIITGVGNHDFGNMDCLDADTNPLYSKKLGKRSTRDIVQFVPFNKYADDPQELAKETLAELPKQLVDYMTARMISPKNLTSNAGPDFYAERTASLLSLFKHKARLENATKLIQTGFPICDSAAFIKALESGYENQLYVKWNLSLIIFSLLLLHI